MKHVTKSNKNGLSCVLQKPSNIGMNDESQQKENTLGVEIVK